MCFSGEISLGCIEVYDPYHGVLSCFHLLVWVFFLGGWGGSLGCIEVDDPYHGVSSSLHLFVFGGGVGGGDGFCVVLRCMIHITGRHHFFIFGFPGRFL